jgi:hypothetical protein
MPVPPILVGYTAPIALGAYLEKALAKLETGPSDLLPVVEAPCTGHLAFAFTSN